MMEFRTHSPLVLSEGLNVQIQMEKNFFSLVFVSVGWLRGRAEHLRLVCQVPVTSREFSSFFNGEKTLSAGWIMVLPLRLAFANSGKISFRFHLDSLTAIFTTFLLAFLLLKYLQRSAPNSEYSHTRNNAKLRSSRNVNGTAQNHVSKLQI